MLETILNGIFTAFLAFLVCAFALDAILDMKRIRARQEWLRQWHIERRVTEGDLWGPSRAKELRPL